jgi:DNA-binding FadR family transcriptional regulator
LSDNLTIVNQPAPIHRRSIVDEIYERLSARILNGEMRPGDALPAELEIAQTLGVSRPAVREALNRLAASRLVSMRHSGAKRVLDFRRAAGLELLSSLLVDQDGRVDPEVVRSVMEMRSAVGPDVARLAAARRDRALVAALRGLVERMRAAAGDLEALQDLADEFWSHLVDGSANVAYRLAYNSLRASYDRVRRLVTQVLASEIADIESYAEIAECVARSEAAKAQSLSRRLLARGEKSIKDALAKLQRIDGLESIEGLGRAERGSGGKRR